MCKYCRGKHPKGECPAYREKCYGCGGTGKEAKESEPHDVTDTRRITGNARIITQEL